MNTIAITIRVTSIIQDKGGNENYVWLDLEYPGFSAQDPTAFSAISCCDTPNNFNQLGTVLNSWTRNDGNKVSTPNSRISSLQSNLKILCANSQKRKLLYIYYSKTQWYCKFIIHKQNVLVNVLFKNSIL